MRIALHGLGVLAGIVFFSANAGAAVGGIPVFLDLPSGYSLTEEEDPLLDGTFFYGKHVPGDTFYFCIDRSRSMIIPGSDKRSALERAKAETIRAIEDLSARSLASVVLCDWARPQVCGDPPLWLNPEGKTRLRGFVSATTHKGGSDIGIGIVKALTMASQVPRRGQQVLVVTDAMVGGGEKADGEKILPPTAAGLDRLFQAIMAKNAHRIPIHTVYVGRMLDGQSDPGMLFLKRLARATGGTFTIAR
jgi:hypothetical protein